jgi:hypothetical protein
MKIRVDSVEYKCWHEVGHATVCLHLGGDVDSIEFLDGDSRGHAVAHCSDVTPEIERSVACGGFAAEFYLLKNGYAEKGADDERDINQIVFHNATHDREEFWGRKFGSVGFTEAEDTEFMRQAIGLTPILDQHFSRMQELVRELFAARRIEGRRVKELLRVDIPTDSADKNSDTIVAGRSCAGCTMCCKLLSVQSLNKPRQKWCDHCNIGVGCRIYESRPRECSAFHCQYLLNKELSEAWKPAYCRMVLDYEPHANRIVVHVDSGRSDAWRREPYYSEIKQWALRASQNQGQVIVWQGMDAMAVLPDREVNLGRVRSDQLIITTEQRTLTGPKFDVTVMERSDPRLAGIQQPTRDDPQTISIVGRSQGKS